MPGALRTSPFDGTDRLIIDGTNLLYRLGVRAGGPAPASAIVGRIRAAVPTTIAIDLVFDGIGHGVYGRLAQRMTVRYSGRRTADDTILDLVSEAAMQGTGPAAVARVLVVSNDRALRDQLLAKGARTVPLQWLIARLDVPPPPARPAGRGAASGTARAAGGAGAPGAPGSTGGPGRRGPSIGQGRPPKVPGAPGADGDERPGWKPGRGATAKTGIAHKVARHKRHPRAGA